MISIFYQQMCFHQSYVIQCKHSIIGEAFNWSQRHNSETMWNWASIYKFQIFISSQVSPQERKFIHACFAFSGIEFHSVGQYLDQMRAPWAIIFELAHFSFLVPFMSPLNPLTWSLNRLIMIVESTHVIFESVHVIFESTHIIFESTHCDRWIHSCDCWIRSCDLWIHSRDLWIHSHYL